MIRALKIADHDLVHERIRAPFALLTVNERHCLGIVYTAVVRLKA